MKEVKLGPALKNRIKRRHIFVFFAAFSLGGLGALALFHYMNPEAQIGAVPGSGGLGGFLEPPSGPSVEQVSQEEKPTPGEMYKLFLCPCCGSTIDANCCEMAVERKAYVDGMLDAGLGKTDAILKMTRRYGINSLANDAMKSEVREILIEQAPDERPQMEIFPGVYDLGNTSVAGGVATTLVHVTNTGKKDLVINRVTTSCGCTTASFIVGEDGERSPRFGMQGQLEGQGWSLSLKPEEVALLRVYYAPDVHPDLRGPVTRTVTLYSNDPIDPELTFKLKLTQVD
jgi:hypothetical protein